MTVPELIRALTPSRFRELLTGPLAETSCTHHETECPLARALNYLDGNPKGIWELEVNAGFLRRPVEGLPHPLLPWQVAVQDAFDDLDPDLRTTPPDHYLGRQLAQRLDPFIPKEEIPAHG